ncbi:MAG: OmpH family outer membrane protein [Flavobacteriales bacterium]|nr:OmpH family outer membrane protein [Flavobacteriales bacterium]MCX7769042.1 OmpH family outer membrane protein [Flavobacteriales bacterium]MDW8410755.1 OmpH family outer membrane protein [Flavobacteriales bacterium]
MKKASIYRVLAAGLLAWSPSGPAGRAQKFAYVDSDYILKNMPEYQSAKAQLNDISQRWQKEIEEKMKAYDKELQEYEAEKVLLTEDMRIKKEEELKKKLEAIHELQRKRFGKDGDLFRKRQELIKPIQDKIYAAIQEIAESKNYGIVFDKAGSTTIMFASAKFDISDQVIRAMGYTPGKTEEETEETDKEGSGIIRDIRERSREMFGGGGTNRNREEPPPPQRKP